MAEVVALPIASRAERQESCRAALLHRFATGRCALDKVEWLRENAGLLGVFRAAELPVSAEALSVYGTFYDGLSARLEFFPQYYRYFLSVGLDLEDLGWPGQNSGALVREVAGQALAGAELSDLGRLEARSLCLRRGIDPLPGDTGLEDRLRAFMARSDIFAVPHRKAANQLAHIVFSLSDHGRCDPGLDPQALQSLQFAGTLACLELNAELLAKICLALRFAGQPVPEAWHQQLQQSVSKFEFRAGDTHEWDDHRPYLAVNWYLAQVGAGGFDRRCPHGPFGIRQSLPVAFPLRELSEALFALGTRRQTDWCKVRRRVFSALSSEARTAVGMAEADGDLFGRFFERFARIGLRAES